MNSINKETIGTYGLLLVALLWGIGFPALKVLSDSMPTFYLIGVRFLIASGFLCLLFFKKLKNINLLLLKNSFILSICLFLTYAFATMGIRYTTSAKASFFSCLGVLVIPIILRLLYKEKLSAKVGISVLICTIGLFLISYSKDMGFALATGDIICLGCSVTGAFHVIITGKVANDQDPVLLATVQLFFISIWGFLVGLIFEDFPINVPTFHIGILVFLAIFCTSLSFALQTKCQQFISSSKVGIIFAVEPVSGAFFSYLLLGDYLGINGIIGGALIFSSILFIESNVKIKKSELID